VIGGKQYSRESLCSEKYGCTVVSSVGVVDFDARGGGQILIDHQMQLLGEDEEAKVLILA
jgi:hypothetical protein